MTFKNILITSIGAKVPLIECVKNATYKFDSNIKIIGADTNSKVLGRYFVDEFWQSPKREELSFEMLLEYCQKNSVSYIIPTSDADVLFFANLQEEFLKNKIFLFCAPLKSAQICNDKLEFAKITPHAIPTSLDIEDVQSSSYVVKERFGAGSQKIALHVNKQEALEFAKKLSNPIFQPFIKGVEYSIDTYLTQKKELKASITRERDLVVEGESKITTYCEDNTIQEMTSNLIKKLDITGHSITQVLKSKNEIYVIECNTRFGGASTLSYKIGLESFYWFLCECENRSFEFIKNPQIKKMVRVQKDFYFED